MTEMEERVARAICREAHNRGVYDDVIRCGRPVDAEDMWKLHIAEARAAFKAMRRPTNEMRKVCSFETAEIEWPAMIDAALAPATVADRRDELPKTDDPNPDTSPHAT